MDKHIMWFWLAVGLAIIIIFSFSLIFYAQQPFYRPVHGFLFTHSHRFFTVNDISRIQSWMTFDYVNDVFRLPPGYLKSSLHISDSHYPDILISQYAGQEKIKAADATVLVQEAVRQYLAAPQ